MAGPEINGRPGQVIDVSETLGNNLITGGYAELIERGPVIETAVIAPPENTDARPKAKRGKK